uniref:Nucleoside diphosphate kinase homolog 7 n=1 Tax=Geotrypetes seraphini TaxID=260995 RepID=A0A6P8QG50_GEOSA|nr:nucleoside diphosphate kinase 7 isoform X2 [Geotrypetes seraphini]
MSDEDRYVFVAEWYDPNAALLRRYNLIFYPKDASIEMYDVKNHRSFLKRTKYDDLKFEDLFIGNKVNIFSRLLHLVDYGDQYTARKLGSKKERTLALIKPDGILKMGEIIDMILGAGLTITKAKMVALTRDQAMDFYIDHHAKPFLHDLVGLIISAPIFAIEILGDEVVSVWKKLMGPTDPSIARSEAPNSIRASFGTDETKNAVHGSDSVALAAQELELFFPSNGECGPTNTAKLTNCTCCIIKPHAVSEGLTGKILSAILEAEYEISALQMFYLERANAEEFLEIYKGVVAEYMDMVVELCSGACVALEIQEGNASKSFREFCGPADPEIARHLRSQTLRARFGKNKIQNAIHCTDLPEDGILEVQYFFKILNN